MDIKLYDVQLFRHPFACIIAGPSGSGKTVLLLRILQDLKKYITPTPERIIYCFSTMQEKFKTLDKIEFHKGLFDLEEFDESKRNLIVYDDLMDECQNDNAILHLFTRGSHHKNISIFLLVQNFFNKGKYSRTISLNSHYTIIFNNPRDKTQIRYLAREMFPENPKYLIEAYKIISKKPYGYLFIDNKQDTDDKIRVQTNITDDIRIVLSQSDNE